MKSIENDILTIRSELLEIKELLGSKFKPQKEFISADETMSLLQINRSTFDRFRTAGIITAYRLNRKLYCKYSEIIEAIENGVVQE